VTALKIGDIDSVRMTIRVEQGKGLFGARQAGRNAERVENMRRRTVEVQRDQLQAASRRPRDPASLLAGCATERSDGAPCPPVVAYSRDFLAHAAAETRLAA
jgi:hypothetical protein